MNFAVKTFFDSETNNATYVVWDNQFNNCIIIDSLLNFDVAAGKIFTEAADNLISFITENGLKARWILETHIHADHLSAASYLKQKLGGRTGIGAGVCEVQRYFKTLYGLGDEFSCDGSQFDHLFTDGEKFSVGTLEVKVIHTPGHTPSCATYIIDENAFTGDTFFMPDSGTARCDFPGGSSKELYKSLRKILALPPETRQFINHDYGCGGSRAFCWETSVAEQCRSNVHMNGKTTEDQFISMRRERDATLAVPRLILPAIQVNIRAGNLPTADQNGKYYLRIPINSF